MFLENASQKGWIEVICGSMFSGKTEELIRRLKRAEFARLRVEIFKPRIDVRYSEEEVVFARCQRDPLHAGRFGAEHPADDLGTSMSWASTRRSSSTRD